jgi:transcriptional regulator with XRE-family HTH domain
MIERIREQRKKKAISQSELARRIGVNQTQYNRYETGRTKIPSDILLRIANELGISVDYLLTGRGISKVPKGFFKDKVFAKLYRVLGDADLENYTEEELSMLRGAAKLIIERVEQKGAPPKKK